MNKKIAFRFYILINLLAITVLLVLGSQEEKRPIAFTDYSKMISACHSSFLPDDIFKRQESNEVEVKPVVKEVKKVVSRGLPRIVISDKEYIMLCRISASETTEGNLKQKMNVISSVLNRVEHYGSIEKAIFAPRQYSVISDGRFYSERITELDKQAVDEVMMNGVTHELIYFKATWCDSPWFDRDLRFIFSDGIHDFYDVK